MLFFFDYADPLSWAIELLAQRAPPGSEPLERFPFDSGQIADDWSERVVEARMILEGMGVLWNGLNAPIRSQKAFELAFHAAESGCFDRVHAAIFEAHFALGRDIGRIDELVRVATNEGLDASETKVVLDVDRHADAVQAWRNRARRAGVTSTPTLSRGGLQVVGIAAIDELNRVVGMETRED